MIDMPNNKYITKCRGDVTKKSQKIVTSNNRAVLVTKSPSAGVVDMTLYC